MSCMSAQITMIALYPLYNEYYKVLDELSLFVIEILTVRIHLYSSGLPSADFYLLVS